MSIPTDEALQKGGESVAALITFSAWASALDLDNTIRAQPVS
jgi:hypothetical protein